MIVVAARTVHLSLMKQFTYLIRYNGWNEIGSRKAGDGRVCKLSVYLDKDDISMQ